MEKILLNVAIVIILYSHKTVTDGPTPWAGVCSHNRGVGGSGRRRRIRLLIECKDEV